MIYGYIIKIMSKQDETKSAQSISPNEIILYNDHHILISKNCCYGVQCTYDQCDRKSVVEMWYANKVHQNRCGTVAISIYFTSH